ncbi:MAG: xanthine dehydrogenase family protein subunit M [Chloroflexota bacterium]|nr:xanthine dehydrogenase family protein subunit M [Chloroflexota bacterium]
MTVFDYLEPHSVRQALSMLHKYGEDARIVGGSTDFLIRWRTGVWSPKYVVNLQHIPSLHLIKYSPRNGLRIGALVTVQEIERNQMIRSKYPAFAAGATSFAGVQIRNLATIGGNICNASPAGDTLPSLLSLAAKFKIVGPNGMRYVVADEFFVGPGKTVLENGEILTEICIPSPPYGSGSFYIKHSPRGAMDISAVGVASNVSISKDGLVCKDVKIALGSVSGTPIRAYGAEAKLLGYPITKELITDVSETAASIASPIDDIRASAEYRELIVPVLVRRTLNKAISIAGGGGTDFDEQRRLTIQATF